MAELADAMDLGSIGNPVQVRPLLSAPSVSVCKSFLADRYFDFRTTFLFVMQQQKYALRKSFIWKLKTEQ